MTDTAQEEAEMLTWARDYARNHGWILNKDEKQLGTVIKGLVGNKNKFGHQVMPLPPQERGRGEGQGNRMSLYLP